MSYTCACFTIRKWSPAAVVKHTPECPEARSAERPILLSECPGGCGMLARRCCDSVVGSDHQNRCRAGHEAFGRMTQADQHRQVLGIAAAVLLLAVVLAYIALHGGVL